MKIKDMFKQLEGRNPEEEIAVAWWDKEFVEYHLDENLTDDEWVAIAEAIEQRDWDEVNDWVVEESRKILLDMREV